MKEITALIRPEKWSLTYQALLAVGVEDVSQHRVLGRGKQSGLHYLRRGAEAGGMAYLPKRMVVCLVGDELVDAVLDAIFESNRTGNVGDGKVFVRTIQMVELTSPETKSTGVLAAAGAGA